MDVHHAAATRTVLSTDWTHVTQRMDSVSVKSMSWVLDATSAEMVRRISVPPTHSAVLCVGVTSLALCLQTVIPLRASVGVSLVWVARSVTNVVTDFSDSHPPVVSLAPATAWAHSAQFAMPPRASVHVSQTSKV